MKSLIAIISAFVLILTFTSCNLTENTVKDESDLDVEVNDVALLEFLKDNISTDSTVDEVVEVFSEMCKTPVSEDLLLFEYGVFGFTGENLFYFDLVRQYPDGGDEFYQLRVSLMFAPDEENCSLYETLWGDTGDDSFFESIRESAGYNYAKNHKIKALDIRIDHTL